MQSKRIFSERLLGILVGKIIVAIFDFYSSRRLGRKRQGREWGKYEFFPDQVLKQQCFLFTKEGLREFADLYFTFAKKTQSRLFERVTTQT